MSLVHSSISLHLHWGAVVNWSSSGAGGGRAGAAEEVSAWNLRLLKKASESGQGSGNRNITSLVIPWIPVSDLSFLDTPGPNPEGASSSPVPVTSRAPQSPVHRHVPGSRRPFTTLSPKLHHNIPKQSPEPSLRKRMQLKCANFIQKQNCIN